MPGIPAPDQDSLVLAKRGVVRARAEQVCFEAAHGNDLDCNHGLDVTILSGETRNYGVVVVGNAVGEDLACSGNTPGVTNFDVPNDVGGTKSGQCAAL